MIIKLLNGDKLKVESDEKSAARRKYKEYSLLSIGLKLKRNLSIASNFLKSGPSISNFGNAISALFGGYNPKNPDVHYGDPPNVGIKDFTRIVRTARVAREFEKAITSATKNGRLEVTSNYFNSPNNWYRITETPEKFGIMEQGKNVTTTDAALTVGTINGWRSSILKAPVTKGTGKNEGYFIKKPPKIDINIRRKNGLAHGNTSQAAKGKLWEGTTSGSNLFPEGIIEGQAPSMINYGIDRTNFVITPWELVPNGGRVGFHTGEMPMSNLGWFQRTKNGTYTYEPVILEKRILVLSTPKITKGKQSRLISSGTYPLYRGPRFNINEIVNPDGTINPRKAMLVLHTVAKQFGKGAYKMEHRLENPEWHKEDPNTYEHTKRVALSAWKIPTPEGYTKLDLMIAALGHDFGKIISGDGHAQIGADLVKQVFIGIKPHLLLAIREHMGLPTTPLGEVTKAADILNGRDFNYLLQFYPELSELKTLLKIAPATIPFLITRKEEKK